MLITSRGESAAPIRVFVNRDRNELDEANNFPTTRLQRAVAAVFPNRDVDIIRRHSEVALDWTPFAQAVPRSWQDICIPWKRSGVHKLGLWMAQLAAIRIAFDADAPPETGTAEEWAASI